VHKSGSVEWSSVELQPEIGVACFESSRIKSSNK
jgi:hypothetical protein